MAVAASVSSSVSSQVKFDEVCKGVRKDWEAHDRDKTGLGWLIVGVRNFFVCRLAFIEPGLEGVITTLGSLSKTFLRASWTVAYGVPVSILKLSVKPLKNEAASTWDMVKQLGTSLKVIGACAVAILIPALVVPSKVDAIVKDEETIGAAEQKIKQAKEDIKEELGSSQPGADTSAPTTVAGKIVEEVKNVVNDVKGTPTGTTATAAT